MSTWLYDLDAILAWTRHPAPTVRRWAVGRWVDRHPRADLVAFARLLLDPDLDTARDVALHLATCGARWVPVLQRAADLHGEEGRPRHRLAMAEALGRGGHPEAAPTLLQGLRRARDGVEVLTWTRAVAGVAHPSLAAALRPLLDRLTDDEPFSALLARALLRQGRRADVGAVVAAWRRWGDAANPALVGAVLEHLGGDRALTRRVARLGELPPSGVIALLGRHGVGPASLGAALDAAWHAGGPTALPAAAHKALVSAFAQRRDDVAAWVHAQREPAPGAPTPAAHYPTLAVTAEALLAALAAPAALEGARALAEARLALGALLLVLQRTDEARALREGPPTTAWALFCADRAEVPPVVTEAVLRAGKRALGPLDALLGSDAPDDVLARAAALVAPLAASGVDTAPLAPALAELVDTRSGTPPAAAAADALVSMGAAAVPALIARLGDPPADDVVAALGRLPTEASFQALARALTEAPTFDLTLAEGLVDLGDARAIDLLLPAWAPDTTPVAAMLEALATLHDLDHPQRAAWCRDLLQDAAEAVLRGAEAAEG